MKYPTMNYKKDQNALHLYVKDIRILTPNEYEQLKNAVPKASHKTIFEILLITGMRYAELLKFYDHSEWYNEKRNLIHLPEEAQKKVKRRQLERTIHPLPSMFSYILNDFLEGKKPPLEATWNKNLQRWAVAADINPYGLSVKTTRKTLESWCIASGILESSVCLRQGHDSLTSMRHYQGLAFTESELQDIKKQLTAWGLLK
jgi:Phage integrase family.